MQRFHTIRIRRLAAGFLGLALFLGGLPAIANPDGAAPLFEPVVVEDSGTYTLSRSIVAASGPAITILPTATDVVIDLNGHTIATLDGSPVVNAVGAGATNGGSLTLRNGKVVRNVPSTMPVVNIQGWQNFFLRSVQITGGVATHDVNHVMATDVTAESVSLNGSLTTPVTGSVTESRFVRAGGNAVEVIDGSAVRFDGITIEDPDGAGVVIDNCDGCQVQNVTVQDAGSTGVDVKGCDGSQFFRLAVFRAQRGFVVDALSQGNTFDHVTASFSTSGPGFDDQGNGTHLMGGTFLGNAGGGIELSGSNTSIRLTVALGNAPPNYEDLAFDTFLDGSNNLQP